MADPLLPHFIYGIVRTKGGTVIADMPLTVTNLSNGDSFSVTTNAAGEYVIDTANFPNGYNNNEPVTIEMSPAYSASDFTLTVSNDNGSTFESASDGLRTTFTGVSQNGLIFKITATNTSVLRNFEVSFE